MRRFLTTLLLTVGATLLTGSPVDAGGPTSVLLSNPGKSTAVALYYTDPVYAELEELLHGPGSVTGESANDPEASSHLNLTWLIHDVTPWRTDSLALGESGAAWLVTRAEGVGVQPSSEPGTWTRLQEGDRIRELVGSLGLLGPAEHGKRGGARAGTAPAAEEGTEPNGIVAPAPAPGLEPTVREETRWFSLTGWRWLVPGVLLGAVVAGLARRRGGNDEPQRRELVDRAPESAASTY